MSYEIVNDYGDFKSGEKVTNISVSAYWVVAVYPLAYPSTYKRSTSKSFDSDPTKGVKLEKPLILFDSVQSVNVSHTKNNHVGSLNAVLYPTEEYLSLINPGDYIFCWMVNSEAKYLSIIERLTKKKPANQFTDGLKFYGRVNAIREQIQQAPDGARSARFILNANSFTELDATFFYEQHLSTLKEGLATQLSQLNLDLDKIIDTQQGYRGVVPNLMIVALIDIFLGKGIKSNLASGLTDPELKSTFGTEGDYAHILPEDVGLVINKTLKSGKALKTADTLEVVHGIQRYSNNALSSDPKDSKAVAGSFQPENTDSEDSRRGTKEDLLGRNSPIPPEFINQSLWSVCQQYLNRACNEMYATLRVNAGGDIVPTVVVRQMPFSTDAANAPVTLTYFSNLPRWVVPEVIVRNTDIGRSDALRFNFVHVYGVSDTVSARNVTQQMVDAPPKYDEMDIARSGLRPFMMTVPCWVDETKEAQGPEKWMGVITDFIMGQHMTLTGSLTTVGIQSPICIGDNLEWDSIVYHIESVSHSCAMAPDGHKTFSTTLGLTHGIGIDTFDSSQQTDVSIYARTDSTKKESSFMPFVDKTSTKEEPKGTGQVGDFNIPEDTSRVA